MSSSGALKVSDKALQSKAIAAANQFNAQQPKRRFKQFLDARFKVPQAILESHRANFVWCPSPLERLCPRNCFKVISVSSSVDKWYEGVKDDQQGEFELIIETRLCYTLRSLFKPFKAYDIRAFESNSMPKPDLYVSTCEGRQPVMVCLVDMENLMGVHVPPGCVLDRLFHYMRLTGTWLGVLTCLELTWICRRQQAPARGTQQTLLVSEAVEAPAKAIGYALAVFENELHSGNGNCVDLHALENGDGKSGSFRYSVFQNADVLLCSFDAEPAKGMLRSMCLELESEYTDRIVNGATTSFDIKDLEHARKLRPVQQRSSLITFKGTYRGQEVVVKVRDLTSAWWYGCEGSLEMMVAELDTYLSLWKVRARFAQLVSWGFMCGAMFAFVMLSDEGKARHERTLDGESWLHECPGKVAALGSVKEALHELHKRGILHGDLHTSKIVLKRQGSEWVAKLVGFAEAIRVDPVSVEGSEQIALEKVKLLELLDDLATTDMA